MRRKKKYHRPAIYRVCPFLDLGLECPRARVDGSTTCGCTQLYHFHWGFIPFSGFSQSHKRKIRKQVRRENYDFHHPGNSLSALLKGA